MTVADTLEGPVLFDDERLLFLKVSNPVLVRAFLDAARKLGVSLYVDERPPRPRLNLSKVTPAVA